jgi:hypothetical protein
LIPSGILWGKLHCLKSRSPWCAVKPPLQSFQFLCFLKVEYRFFVIHDIL